jgi:hypothetical protein
LNSAIKGPSAMHPMNRRNPLPIHRTNWGMGIADLGLAIFRGNRRLRAASGNPKSPIQNPK